MANRGTLVYSVGKNQWFRRPMERVVHIAKTLLIAVLMLTAGCEAELRDGHTEPEARGSRDDSGLRTGAGVRADSGFMFDAERHADSGFMPGAERHAQSDLRTGSLLRTGSGRPPADRATPHGSGIDTRSDTSEFREERLDMVRRQIAARGIDDPLVLEALRIVPRHRFVPLDFVRQAYADRPLPIGHGQTISQPYIVAYMTALVEPDASDRVLEVGAGSGYQAAVLAQIVDTVYTIEIVPDLARTARDRLQSLGYGNVRVRQADGFYGWEEHAPFDAIVVTAAAEHIPPPLVDQLKNGGRMIIPVGSPFRTQTLMLVEKQGDELSTRSVAPVRFVPFTRDN